MVGWNLSTRRPQLLSYRLSIRQAYECTYSWAQKKKTFPAVPKMRLHAKLYNWKNEWSRSCICVFIQRKAISVIFRSRENFLSFWSFCLSVQLLDCVVITERLLIWQTLCLPNAHIKRIKGIPKVRRFLCQCKVIYVPVISKTLERIETFNTNYKDFS